MTTTEKNKIKRDNIKLAIDVVKSLKRKVIINSINDYKFTITSAREDKSVFFDTEIIASLQHLEVSQYIQVEDGNIEIRVFEVKLTE